jgi:uncharacterized membrane protein
MKILKKILLVVVILIALPLVAALFVKKAYTVEREVVIAKPKQEVFAYIKLLKNQNEFSKWAKMDPDMVKTFKGEDGTVGFVSAWDSKKDDVGAGEQTIAKITEGERIDYNLHFIRPFESDQTCYLTTEAAGDQTKVKWGFNGSMPYPMNVLLLVMDMEKMIGDDLQTGLNNLKVIMEQ